MLNAQKKSLCISIIAKGCTIFQAQFMLSGRIKVELFAVSILILVVLSASTSSSFLPKSAEGHGVPEQFQGQMVRVTEEQFSDITVNTGDIVTVTGILQNQLDRDLEGLSLSINVETAVQGKSWEIVSTNPSSKTFDISAGGEVPYEMQLVALKPGVYHVHTQLNIPDEDMSLGPGQTMNVEGSPINQKDIDSILSRQNATAPVSEEEKIRRMLVNFLGQNVSKVDMEILNDEINCNDPHGMIQAVIFSNSTFDATKLQPDSIYMNKALEFHTGWGQHYVHEQDFNGDGLADMVYHFNFYETQLSCTDTMTYVTGFFPDGPRIFGVDKLNMVSKEPPARERFNSLNLERITSPARLEQALNFCPIEQTLKNTTDYGEVIAYAKKHNGRIDRPLCLHITAEDLDKFAKIRHAIQQGEDLLKLQEEFPALSQDYHPPVGLTKNETKELTGHFNLMPYDLPGINRDYYTGFALIDNATTIPDNNTGSKGSEEALATYYDFILVSSVELPDRFWIIYPDVERNFLRSSVVVEKGSSITIPIAIEPLFSVDRPIEVNFTGVTYGSLDHPAVMPPGVSAKIEPEKLVLDSNDTNKAVVNLTISADEAAPDGTYGLRISAMSKDKVYTFAQEQQNYPYIPLVVGNGSADLVVPSGVVCPDTVSNIANYQPYVSPKTYETDYLAHKAQHLPGLETPSNGQPELPVAPYLKNTTIPDYAYEKAREIAKSILLKNLEPFYNVTYASVLYNVSLDGYYGGFFINPNLYQPETLAVGIHAQAFVANNDTAKQIRRLHHWSQLHL